MNRLGKTALALLGLTAFLLLLPPAASACCRPCAGYCEQPGVPATAYCCTGIPVPGNACGLTTCGKYLGSADTASLETSTLEAQLAALFASESTASTPSCAPAGS